MSADNGIYILHTTTEWQEETRDGITSRWSDHTTRSVWRVAHLQAIDSLEWYREKQPYNFGAYLLESWGKSKEFYNYADASAYALELHDQIGYTEYGICSIDLPEYRFFGD